MRSMWLVVAVAACTPDVVSGAYLCGPEATCPEGQLCNGPDNTCVIASTALPFACEPRVDFEPDDAAADAHLIPSLGCVSVPFVAESCMLAGDPADWVKFVAPSVCTAVAVEARLAFPVAFERLALELWDLDQGTMIGIDDACTSAGEGGAEFRCATFTLTPGTTYGINVHPAGDGDCQGACAYNRYTLSVQLATPR